MKIQILYGVSQSRLNSKAFNPVVFVNGVSQYNPAYRAAKTPKGALARAERYANAIAKEQEYFNNEVILSKWQHSVI